MCPENPGLDMGGALISCKKSTSGGDAVAPEHDDVTLSPRGGRAHAYPNTVQNRRTTTNARPPRPHAHEQHHQHQNAALQQHPQQRKKQRSRPRYAGTPLRPIATATIDYTPVAKADREKYKYSCPLCFCYFADTILVTSCCGNYACYECSLDHAKQKGGVHAKSKVLAAELKGVPCPHCNSPNVQFAYASSKDVVRSYDTSPATKARMAKLGDSESSPRPISPSEDSRLNEECSIKEAPAPVDGEPETEHSPPKVDILALGAIENTVPETVVKQ